MGCCYFINLILNLNLFKNVEGTTAVLLPLCPMVLVLLPPPLGAAPSSPCTAGPAARGGHRRGRVGGCPTQGLGAPTAREGLGDPHCVPSDPGLSPAIPPSLGRSLSPPCCGGTRKGPPHVLTQRCCNAVTMSPFQSRADWGSGSRVSALLSTAPGGYGHSRSPSCSPTGEGRSRDSSQRALQWASPDPGSGGLVGPSCSKQGPGHAGGRGGRGLGGWG